MIQFEELLLALNELENIVVVCDKDGKIRFVNDAFVSKYEYSREEVIGKTPRIIRTNYHDDQFYKDMWRTILNGETWEGTFLNKTKSGRLIWEQAKISPIQQNGKLDGFIAVKEDITYKKELEEQFHKEKYLLDELFNNAPVGVILFKPIYNETIIEDLIAIKANPVAGAVFNQLGIVGLNLSQFLPDFPNLDYHAKQMLIDKQNFEQYFKSIDKHLNMRSFPLDDSRFCMYVHDVTQYKNNIEALRKSEQRYSSLVEDSPALIRRFNHDGTISYVNSYYADYFNKTPSQFIGTNIFKLLKKENQEAYIERFKNLSPSNPIVEQVYKMKLSDGSTRWQKWIDRALIDSAGNIVEYQSVGMDFTRLKNTEKLLADQKNKLNAIFNNSIMGIGVINNKGEFLMVNSKLREMLGYTLNEEITYNYFQHIYESNPKQIIENFNDIFEGKIKTLNVQRQFQRIDGSVFWADLFASPISVKKGKPNEVVGMVIDITERHQIEQELKDNEQKLKKLNRTKDKLFSIIAHDIRNPFNTILGFSTLLNKNIDKFSQQETKEFTRRIVESGEQTYKLLEDLLTWAKSQLGQLKINKEYFDLNKAINECIDSLKSIASGKNIQLQNKIPPDTQIFCDFEMCRFVIRNLMHNGIKFSHPNSLVICGIVENNNTNTITIYVKDYGIGINSNKIKVLFELEEFLSTAGTSQEKGTGLGLSLTKEMVELNNGTIEVISEVNVGSEFRITLPLK